MDEEIVSASQYNLEIQKVLNRVRPSTTPSPPRSERSAVSQENSVSKAELRTALSGYHPQRELSLPKLECVSFSGGKDDRFLFRSFLLSYNNVYGCRLDISEAAKLQYLKSHLSGYALKDIEHLSNVDENLEVALEILKSQYLDEPYIVDSLMHRIDSAPILSGKNLEDVRAFIAEVRAYLHELKEFGWNFLEENTPGCKFLSHVIVDKLPSIFLRELKLITQEEYPSINIIFKHSNYILKSLEKTREKNSFYGKDKTTKVSSSSPSKKKSSSYHNSSEVSSPKKSKSKDELGSSSGEHKTSILNNPLCKLCEGKHFMNSCVAYSSPKLRRERCVALRLCTNCSSANHHTKDCPAKRYGLSRPCWVCKSRVHITALCSSNAKSKTKSGNSINLPSTSSNQDTEEDDERVSNNVCINLGNSSSGHILPTISLKMRNGNKVIPVRVLLDLGSQRSYFHPSVLSKLSIDIYSLPSHNSSIKTFLGEQVRTMRHLELDLNICCRTFKKLPVYIDSELDVSFDVKGLMGAIYNIKACGFKVADSFYTGNHADQVTNIEGLLGTDALCLMKHFCSVSCVKGSIVRTCSQEVLIDLS